MTVRAASLPILACSGCQAPVRYATEVEAVWNRKYGGWPDPIDDCLWCAPKRRAATRFHTSRYTNPPLTWRNTMTEPTLSPSAAALIEAATGHLYNPELDDETKALGVSESAVAVGTSFMHEASGCTEPDPTYDDLDQMMTTCPKCESLVTTVLKLGKILDRGMAGIASA